MSDSVKLVIAWLSFHSKCPGPRFRNLSSSCHGIRSLTTGLFRSILLFLDRVPLRLHTHTRSTLHTESTGAESCSWERNFRPNSGWAEFVGFQKRGSEPSMYVFPFPSPPPSPLYCVPLIPVPFSDRALDSCIDGLELAL